jgi:hypothetical protein
MTTPHNGSSDGYIDLKVATDQEIEQSLAELIGQAARRHDSLKECATHAVDTILVGFLVDMYRQAMWFLDGDQALTIARASVDKLISDADINIAHLIILGDAARLARDLSEGRNVSHAVMNAFYEARNG